jgi:hypothetical protein
MIVPASLFLPDAWSVGLSHGLRLWARARNTLHWRSRKGFGDALLGVGGVRPSRQESEVALLLAPLRAAALQGLN